MAVCARVSGIGVIMAGLIALFVCIPFNPGSCSAENGVPGAKEETFVLPERGLIWTRNANPAGQEMTWSDSLVFLNGLNGKKFAGCEGWRMPSREELADMLTYLESGNGADDDISPEQDYYWSSSTDPLETGYADAVNMADGTVDICQKIDINYVWPVCGP